VDISRRWPRSFSLFVVEDLQIGLRCNGTLLFVGVVFVSFGGLSSILAWRFAPPFMSRR
jgi:hypothetical protein